MSVEYLRLQCVRGSLSTVCRTVESLVAKNGWKRLSAGKKCAPAHFYKEVNIREENGWIVIDAGEGHAEPWAARIAESLRTTGIRMTSYGDEDALELDRYDADQHTKQLSLRFDTERPPVRLPLGFLADLVPTSRRSALRRGIVARPLGSDATVREIARLAGLPKPLGTHEWPREGRLLRFEHAPPERVSPSPVVSPTTGSKRTDVLFEETFHVRGAALGAIERAIATTLALDEFIPVPTSADPVTWAAGLLRMFVHDQSGTLSFGELAIDDGRTVPTFKWGEILSRKLDKPVLSIWKHGDGAEATLWVGGRERSRVGFGSIAGGFVGESIDATPLAAFVTRSARRKLASIDGTCSLDVSVQLLGAALGLAAPVLAGELEGSELRFRRTGVVSRTLYQIEQDALDWAARAPNLAKLNPLFSHFADVTPEQELRAALTPARRV